MPISIEVNSAQEMTALGFAVGRDIPSPSILLLRGGMGAGKTTFVQGLARALGVSRVVTSPTFLTAREYKATCGKFIHCDLYRIEDPMYLEELGVLDEAEKGAVVAIEWPKDIDLEGIDLISYDLTISQGVSELHRVVTFSNLGNLACFPTVAGLLETNEGVRCS
ncbi:tRNA threonylcarbamoyladenosine biosynthesis protein TsaE [Ferrithrix thermotolerans DSM 19514]|uniref:tRNA threonylcarbamoyladenosine biosynthesis protein TsaE n=1 Tax=Ferrithrix thermotolerans DSM 19514 TaxID=1121881 RepID=A0A1M4SV44_9ACTN|nr:tRNA (adenosine(37)-N6)-threonylcarbamoyltransferase complex ATPase subunit type 1 TsaE [Ferrithrix thermotolerans]SHE36072.1 tRNA threonylcarbamoyladenosine biosynthesis protein TsaE [Ferrithrix thermotolerans DSM 19514]